MPDNPEIVINTTPILSLIAATGSLDVLLSLYSRVWVSLEVCQEVQKGGSFGLGVAEFAQAQFLYRQTRPATVSVLLILLCQITWLIFLNSRFIQKNVGCILCTTPPEALMVHKMHPTG